MINGKAYKGVMHFQFNPAAEPNEAIGKLTATGNRSFTFWKHGTSYMFTFSSGSQRRRSLSLPVLTLIFPALLPCLVRDSLCTALQTKILWINWSLNAIDTIETWVSIGDSLCTALQTKILWINWSLNAIDTIETWVSGNLTALTERSQPAIRWRVGEVANRVSCGSFRGGH